MCLSGKRPPQMTEPQWETTKPQKFLEPKICFLWPVRRRKIRRFQRLPLFSKSDKKWRRYRKKNVKKCDNYGLMLCLIRLDSLNPCVAKLAYW